ncbi:hypothetical protein CDAR_589951 [Caerostris darwini]|uniref:Secreted protein n=1 Tax=Caerostris darwini TaxID=1538125 RepID=A0AAV4NWZ0_9ARAC|nr:hypothetical protein CDAR_589951 [Caerostris darwini]
MVFLLLYFDPLLAPLPSSAALATAAVFALRSFSTASQLLKPILTQETFPWQRCFPPKFERDAKASLYPPTWCCLFQQVRGDGWLWLGQPMRFQGLPTLH